MEVRITKGRPEDHMDIVDFINMVFREDFLVTESKLYLDRPEMAEKHHLVWEDDRIKAVVGNFPVSLNVAGRKLSAYGIGSVSVHPYSRSRGYMKTLMNNALEEAEKEGAALMMLGGKRQRYEYFGFTKCGTVYSFNLDQNVRRHLKQVSSDEIELLPMCDHKEYLRDCIRLWETQPLYADRKAEDLCDILQTCDSVGYVILLRGEFLGFCSIHNSGGINELTLCDYSYSANVAMKLCEEVGKPFAVKAFPHQRKLIHTLNLICQGHSLSPDPSFNVLDYPKVIEAFLTLKGMNEPLVDGRLVIEVQEKGKWAVEVCDGTVSVTETSDKPQISLPHIQMMCRLFSPFGQIGEEELTPEMRSWLPIPLYLPRCDDV